MSEHKRAPTLKLHVAVLASMTLALPAMAEGTARDVGSTPLAGLHHCRNISQDKERLACYDQEETALDTMLTDGDITIVNKDAVKSARRSLFGFPIPDLSAFGMSKSDEKSPDAISLDSTVTAATSTGYDHWNIEIADNHALWRNTDPIDERPTVGAPIHFHKALLGAYFVKIGNGRAFRAVRVR